MDTLTTYSGLTDRLAKGQGHLQEVLDCWPSEADGFLDLEDAIRRVGQCIDWIESAAREEGQA